MYDGVKLRGSQGDAADADIVVGFSCSVLDWDGPQVSLEGGWSSATPSFTVTSALERLVDRAEGIVDRFEALLGTITQLWDWRGGAPSKPPRPAKPQAPVKVDEVTQARAQRQLLRLGMKP